MEGLAQTHGSNSLSVADREMLANPVLPEDIMREAVPGLIIVKACTFLQRNLMYFLFDIYIYIYIYLVAFQLPGLYSVS